MFTLNWNDKEILLRWLALASLAEWFIVRTVTRAAIHLPKSPLVISLYQGATLVGQVAGIFVSLLALLFICWLAWGAWQERQLVLSFGLTGLAVFSLLFLVIAPPAWLALLYQLLAVIFIFRLVYDWFFGIGSGNRRANRLWQGAVLLFPALALLAGLFYQLLPTFYTAVSWPGPAPFTGLLFNLGELLVVVAVIIWWGVFGRQTSFRYWLIAAVPALMFIMLFQRDPATTGILAIWSSGLTLFLPWPLYAVALWLAGAAVLSSWRRNPPVAYAILLLASAGYAPQLSSQLFCALIGLWILAQGSLQEAEYRNSVGAATAPRLQPITES